MANSELFREFEFLPNLPKANLDDRTFNDLIQECKLRIPRYCQEWTNHNPSDPGITLIELFAWLTDQMLLRFNQVPRLNYVAFLELLGIRLQPPAAATVDLTFYLTKPVVAGMGTVVPVPQGTEVATMRTESEPSVVFTTSHDLVVGKAVLKGLFTAHHKDQDASDWSRPLPNNPQWDALNSLRIFETSEVGNCFYVVLAPEQGDSNRINGNVIALTFKGVIAGSTGIDPTDPPVRWQAWNGEEWVDDILLQPEDDKTKGFSFHELQEQGANPEQGADVVLHLPIRWPEVDLGTDCRGHWIRCVYEPRDETDQPDRIQYLYSRSPLINAMQVRTIGGAVEASECVTVKNELVGISSGKPGQKFQLEGFPILKRNPETEHIVVKAPDGTQAFMGTGSDGVGSDGVEAVGEVWQEVDDFGDSALDEIATHAISPNSPQNDLQNGEADHKRHYTLDSQTGSLQFGPLVREPSQLQYQTLERTRYQPWGRDIQQFSTRMEMDNRLIAADDSEQMQRREWQYGQVPSRGAEIYMSAYRVGGGSRGNVQKETLVKLKTAVPYVKSVINHKKAQGGKDAESLDEAVLRVPQVLRNAKTAMIPADFEVVAKEAHARIYRAHCLPCISPGVVRLLAIASPPHWSSQPFPMFSRGIDPKHYEIAQDSQMYKSLSAKFEEHKLLGVQVRLESPTYVGVQVEADVLLDAKYRSPQLQDTIAARIKAHLYQYINPLTGGGDGNGWPLGRELSPSDVIAQLQSLPEVQYVGAVNLFTLRYHPYDGWFHSDQAEAIVNPGPLGLLCSWQHDHIDSGHRIRFMRQ